MKRAEKIALLLLLCTLLSLFSGCKKPVEVAPEAPSVTFPEPMPEPEPEPEPEPVPAFTNPLTGEPTEEDISARRPYAVMLNNIKVALPQYGVSHADIIYEALAEGGITRMLGVFQDVRGLGSIGSVRSARPYYIELAQGHDAVYVHAGGSPQAYSDLSAKGVDHVDGVNGNTGNVFFRDQARIRSAGYEHSMFTDGGKLTEIVDQLESIRHTHGESYTYGQTFAEDAVPVGEDAPLVRAYFTSSKKTSFAYDDPSGQYLVYEYDAPYVDGADGAQVAVKNVLCLFTDVHQIAGDDKGRMSVRTTGEGTGLFACGGKAVNIRWSRASAEAPFTYTTEDGTPLTLGVGHSFVCILPMDAKLTLTE